MRAQVLQARNSARMQQAGTHMRWRRAGSSVALPQRLYSQASSQITDSKTLVQILPLHEIRQLVLAGKFKSAAVATAQTHICVVSKHQP
jgi:hypothetical protein